MSPAPVRILLLAESEQVAAWLAGVLREARAEAVCTLATDEAQARELAGQGAPGDDGGSHGWDLLACQAAWPQAPRMLEVASEAGAGDLPLMLLAATFDEIPDRLYRPGAFLCQRKRGASHVGPAVQTAARLRDERAQRKKAEAFEAGQRQVLEAIASGTPLASVLEQIVLLVERQADGMYCSILLLDQPREGEGSSDRPTVRLGAAPHLPPELSRGIEGAEIGPRAGSCGAAAYLRERVIIEDIGTHPNWTEHRHLAIPHGLRACWSTPIFSGDRAEVLGTFAMYYREPRRPTEEELLWVDRATHLASIAISRDLAERTVRQSESRYRQIVDTAWEGVWLVDAKAITLFVNERTAEMLGRTSSEMLGRSLFDFMDEGSQERARGGFLERLRTLREQQEFCFTRKDGSRFWALMSGSPIRDDRGRVVGALGMLTDISELKLAERALRQSDAELQILFHDAALGMALVDAEGHPVRTNPSLQQCLGYSEAELRELTIAQIVHPDDAAENLELARAMMEGRRESYQNEARFVRKDGTLVWVRVTASVVRPARENPRRAIAMIEDVSERRQMEESVRASERLRTLMYNAVTDVVFYVGVEPEGRFRFLSVNPAFLKATGLPESAVVGRLVSEVIPPASLDVVLGNYRRAIEERRLITWDEVTAYPAGVKYGEVAITPIFDAAGKCTNLLGTVHDVTQTRLAQQRIAAQAALLDQATDAILVRALDGTVEYWNQSAERIYGWSAQEALGKTVEELIYDDPTEFRRFNARTIEEGAWSGELVQTTREGKPRMMQVRWTLLRDDQGRPKSVLAINTDVTERRHLEAVVARRQRLESLGTMAGGIAHDFNNILAVVVGNVDIALRSLPAGHPAREALATVEEATSAATNLVAQILTFSRQREAKRVRLELRPSIEEALRLLLSANPGLRLEKDFDPGLPSVLADPTQLHQVVMNLGTNAAHAMNGAGTLRIRAERAKVAGNGASPDPASDLAPGDYAKITFSDSGSGMDQSTLEHIFEPFFTTKPEGQGTGLGLSVVDGIIKAHGGGITVRSAPGRGTDFTLYLPGAG